jgi:hypothetical protein
MKETDEFKLINESFPHVGERIEVFWGSREFVEYTDRLFFDTRDGIRKGFPPYILSAISKLRNTHDRRFPEFVKVEESKPPFTFGHKRY